MPVGQTVASLGGKHVPERNRPYRLGLDLGSNSIGWFVVWLDDKKNPVGLGPGGVRIFPDGRDPQSKTSNAAARRVARGARRRRDRYLRRRTRLLDELVAFGLMPAEATARKVLELFDPYELRTAALDRELPLHHVGRALFHLNQRRGFKSNRKTDSGGDEAGAVKEAVSRLKDQLAESGSRTLGEFLNTRQQARDGTRARNRATGTKASYDFYPSRDLVEAEFDAIWSSQARFHPAMDDAACCAIRKTIFHQRPLREPQVGKCQLDPAQGPDDAEGFRCPWAHPLAQRFRILQEARNLAIGRTGESSRRLSKEEGDLIALSLQQSAKVGFDKLRRLVKAGDDMSFNLESEKRTELKGDETAGRLAHRDRFGKSWRGLPTDRQTAIVERLLEEEDEEALVGWLVSETGIDMKAAQGVAATTLPSGHCRLGLRAIRRLLPLMEGGMRYDEAATVAYGSHSSKETGEVVDRLPYYGAWLSDEVIGSGDPRDAKEKRLGRLPNPTVHIGLGQLRRVANALVDRLGPPQQIVVEMTRDFQLSPKRLREVEQEQTKNQRRNEERKAVLDQHRLPPTARNILKLRLWEDLNLKDPLDRRCPFTGEVISIQRLLSDEVEIEHLIPFQESWDDSATNKIVCMRFANRAKGKRTPHEAFGSSPTVDGWHYDWDGIRERARALPRGKRWRFDPDARRRFEREGGFLARQLNETGWLARLAKSYMGALLETKQDVWVLPGRMTAMVRAKWGLNDLLPDHNFAGAKNRLDHRHHAIDAMVAGMTDRSLLQRIASAYDDERDRIEVPMPWESLRDELNARLEAMIVSHRPDHGTSGRLHEDTAYGVVDDAAEGNLVYRKSFLALKPAEIGRIRDRRLRDLVEAHVAAAASAGHTFEQALATFNDTHRTPHTKEGVRHVRLLKPEKPEYLVPIRDREGNLVKAYSAGENAFVDIYEAPDGKWRGEATTVFQANRPEHRPAWSQTAENRFVMRVFKGDLMALDHGGGRRTMVVHRLDAAAGRFKLAPHNEAGNLDRRHNEPDDPFRWLMASYGTLKAAGAECVRVDELGRIWRIRPDELRRGLKL